MFRRLQTNRRSRKKHDRNRYRRNEFLRGIEQLEPRLVLSGVTLSPAFIQIGLAEMRSDPAFAQIDGSGIGIAILDTGTFSDHPDLKDNWLLGQDFSNNTQSDVTDNIGHGTHVAGIAASSDSNIGVAYEADIIGLKVFTDATGGSPQRDQLSALEWIENNHASYNIKVVNLSLGAGHYSDDPIGQASRIDAFRRLEDLGITIVAAAGNSYLGTKKDDQHVMESNSMAPGIYATLNVGAVWEAGETGRLCWTMAITACDVNPSQDDIIVFSQRPVARPNVIFAPGGSIYSTAMDGSYIHKNGTRME